MGFMTQGVLLPCPAIPLWIFSLFWFPSSARSPLPSSLAELQKTQSSVPKMSLVPCCADSTNKTILMRVQVLLLVLQNRKKDGFIYLDKNKNIKDNAEVWHCY